MAELKFKLGDRVVVTGTMYQSANGQLPARTLTHADAYVTKVAENAVHPYMINNILGWFDEKSLTKYVEPPVHIGDRVNLIKNVTYSGKRFKSWYNEYEVVALESDKATIAHNGTVVAIVNAFNLKKV